MRSQRPWPQPVLLMALLLWAIGGCSRGSSTPASASALSSAGPSVASNAAVHLTEYSSDDGPRSSVILTGAIGDFGEAISVHPDGTINPDHDSQSRLELSHGSFRLDIKALDSKLVAAFDHLQPDPRTCSAHTSVTAAAPIVKGSGTGSYSDINGTIALSVSVDEVFQTCSTSAPYLAQAIVTTGTGSVSYP